MSKRKRQSGQNDEQLIIPDGVLGQLWALNGIVRGMQIELIELRHWYNKAAVKTVVEEVYGEDIQRLEKLKNDAIHVLNLMVEKGVMTREELNEATR